MQRNCVPAKFLLTLRSTVEQFKSALLAVRDKNMASTHLDMLRAQCRAPNSTITSTRLAEAAGYQNYNAANLQYGTLANKVAEPLGFSPAARADGSLMWWTTLSYSDEGAGSLKPDSSSSSCAQNSFKRCVRCVGRKPYSNRTYGPYP